MSAIVAALIHLAGDLLIGMVSTSVVVHMVAFATDAGVSQAAASTAYGASLAVNGIGIIFFGIAADRLPLRIMMGVCYGASAIAMLFAFRLPSLAGGEVDLGPTGPGDVEALFTGDLHPGGRTEALLLRGDHDAAFGDALPLLRGADLSVTNLEAPLTLAHTAPGGAVTTTGSGDRAAVHP